MADAMAAIAVGDSGFPEPPHAVEPFLQRSSVIRPDLGTLSRDIYAQCSSSAGGEVLVYGICMRAGLSEIRMVRIKSIPE
jgi:hypothetical protein